MAVAVIDAERSVPSWRESRILSASGGAGNFLVSFHNAWRLDI